MEGDVDKISQMFNNLTSRIDKMSQNIENISQSLVELSKIINESMMHVSEHLEDLIQAFDQIFKFKDLISSSNLIQNFSEKLAEKFNEDEFHATINEINELIMTLKELKECEIKEEEKEEEK
ncbi:MAG: hypothetical protein ACTSRP_25070 [Candidatus Helarchaeota archaeon]